MHTEEKVKILINFLIRWYVVYAQDLSISHSIYAHKLYITDINRTLIEGRRGGGGRGVYSCYMYSVLPDQVLLEINWPLAGVSRYSN